MNKDAIIEAMISEDSEVTIRDYLELLRELEAIELSTKGIAA